MTLPFAARSLLPFETAAQAVRHLADTIAPAVALQPSAKVILRSLLKSAFRQQNGRILHGEPEKPVTLPDLSHDPILTGVSLGTYSTGIKDSEVDNTEKLQIFGDPSQGYVTLYAAQIDRVELLTVSGQLVFSSVNPNLGQYFLLPTVSLQKGFYLVRAFNGKKALVSKLLIQ